MLVVSDMEWTRKAVQKLVCAMPRKWRHLRPNSSQDAGASGARAGKYVVERKLQRTSREMRYCRSADG